MKYSNVISYQPSTCIYSESSSFYIISYCNDGSRHYSANMSYEEALNEIFKYDEITKFFGGGIIELIEKPNKVIKFKCIIV